MTDGNLKDGSTETQQVGEGKDSKCVSVCVSTNVLVLIIFILTSNLTSFEAQMCFSYE